jgi:hypothetical protein
LSHRGEAKQPVSKCHRVSSSTALAGFSESVQAKLFGDGRPVPLDRNAEVRDTVCLSYRALLIFEHALRWMLMQHPCVETALAVARQQQPSR